MNLPSQVLTFYSYKGGVGRSMGLANVAALLAKWRRKVLVVDWDLEAPGIEAYFKICDQDISERRKSTPGVIDLVKAVEAGQQLDWHDCLLSVRPFEGEEELKFISAGKDDGEYMHRVQHTDWDKLFNKNELGRYIEELRNSWKKEFDFVLVDSRTGITDIGGVCTIHLPDYLLVWFTTNDTSIQGVKNVAKRARLAQNELPFDRNPLLILPVLARDESLTEFKMAEKWKDKIADELKDLYDEWLPSGATPKDVIARIRIQYVPYWSFGETLPVVEQATAPISSDYEALAKLIFFHLDWAEIDTDPEHSIEYLSRAVETNLEHFGPEYADILFEQASGFYIEGPKQESIEFAKRAVEIWRRLAATNFSSYGPKLAKVQSFLLDRIREEEDEPRWILEATKAESFLSEIDPIKFAEEAVPLYTSLSESFHNFGNIEKAIELLQKLRAIQEYLPETKRARFDEDLAKGFFNLSNYLTESYQHNEALKAAQEATDIYRNLITDDGEMYEPDLASALSNLSECLVNIGDMQGALTAGHEAVEIFKRLAQQNPKRYEADLVSSLNALLDPISQLSIEEATAFFMFVQEAIGSFRRLAQKDPKRYEPDLAKSLNMLPDLLVESGDIQQALIAQQEAIEIFRRLTRSNPDLYESELATSLKNLSELLFQHSNITTARAPAQEAVNILQRLSQANPTRYKEELDGALELLSKVEKS